MVKKAMIMVVAFECKFLFSAQPVDEMLGMLSCYKLRQKMLLLLSGWVNMVKITWRYHEKGNKKLTNGQISYASSGNSNDIMARNVKCSQ